MSTDQLTDTREVDFGGWLTEPRASRTRNVVSVDSFKPVHAQLAIKVAVGTDLARAPCYDCGLG